MGKAQTDSITIWRYFHTRKATVGTQIALMAARSICWLAWTSKHNVCCQRRTAQPFKANYLPENQENPLAYLLVILIQMSNHQFHQVMKPQ